MVCRLPLVHGSRVWRRNVPTFIITETGSDAIALTRQVCPDLIYQSSYVTIHAGLLKCICNAADKVLHQQFRSRLFSQQTML